MADTPTTSGTATVLAQLERMAGRCGQRITVRDVAVITRAIHTLAGYQREGDHSATVQRDRLHELINANAKYATLIDIIKAGIDATNH